MGNHEQMMLDAYDSPDTMTGNWWSQGGAEAADSYAGGSGSAGANWRETIPREHITWLRSLRSIYRDDERRLVFVHAGIDPATFPDCDPAIRLWTRSAEVLRARCTGPSRDELRRSLRHPRPHAEKPPARKSPSPHQCRYRRLLRRPAHRRVLKDGEAPSFMRAGA